MYSRYIAAVSALNDKLVDELQKVMAEFEVLAKSAISAAGEHAGDVAHEVKLGAHKTDSYIHDRPWMAIGIAAAAAFLLGVALARRD